MAVAHAHGVMQAVRGRGAPLDSHECPQVGEQNRRARTAIGIQPADSGKRFVRERYDLICPDLPKVV
jgi:hypothetical protein